MSAISSCHNSHETTFCIEGDLTGQTVTELKKAWRAELRAPFPNSICIDLRSTREIDSSGKQLLSDMFGTGIQIRVPVRNKEKRT